MDVERELADLREHWGEAYKINVVLGRWLAARLDNGEVLSASTAEKLREKIRKDYQKRPVPRGR